MRRLEDCIRNFSGREDKILFALEQLSTKYEAGINGFILWQGIDPNKILSKLITLIKHAPWVKDFSVNYKIWTQGGGGYLVHLYHECTLFTRIISFHQNVNIGRTVWGKRECDFDGRSSHMNWTQKGLIKQLFGYFKMLLSIIIKMTDCKTCPIKFQFNSSGKVWTKFCLHLSYSLHNIWRLLIVYIWW